MGIYPRHPNTKREEVWLDLQAYHPNTEPDKLSLMEEILHQLRLVVYPIIYKAFYIPAGLGFLPSTVAVIKKTLLGCFFNKGDYTTQSTNRDVPGILMCCFFLK